MNAPEAPSRKVSAATGGGAAAIVLAWVLGLLGLDVPPEVAAGFATLFALAAGYATREQGGTIGRRDT